MKAWHIVGFLLWLLLSIIEGHANLLIDVNGPKRSGDKAVIKLEMKNTFPEKIESARAVVFLLNYQGKVVGQMTRWVVVGTPDRPALAPNSTTTYNFVVSTEKLFTTTKLSINRIVLEGGKLADVTKDVTVTPAK